MKEVNKKEKSALTEVCKRGFPFLSILIFLIFLTATVLFVLFVREKSKNRTYLDPVVSDTKERAKIFDKNGLLLAIDMPENILCFDAGIASTYNNPDEIKRFFSDNFLSDILPYTGYKSGLFVIEKNTESLRRVALEKQIKAHGFDSFLYFNDELKRVYFSDLSDSPWFRSFIGSIDSGTRHGLSGIEAYADDYLLSVVNLGSIPDNGSDVVLTVDIELCRRIERALEDARKDVHVLVIDTMSGALSGIYSNNKVVRSSSDLLNFPDISSSDIFKSLIIGAMLEQDPTLIEEYYCRGGGKCRIAHGEVNLSNIIHCSNAIANLTQNNYISRELSDRMAGLNVTDTDIYGLISLSFVAYCHEKIPSLRIIADIKDNGRHDEFDGAPEFFSVELSDYTAKYFQSVLSRQCDDLKVFYENNRFLTVLYEQGGIEKGVEVGVRKTVSDYYPD